MIYCRHSGNYYKLSFFVAFVFFIKLILFYQYRVNLPTQIQFYNSVLVLEKIISDVEYVPMHSKLRNNVGLNILYYNKLNILCQPMQLNISICGHDVDIFKKEIKDRYKCPI
jgi:hypothetical protein